jgi:hypothetical protein
MARDQRSNSIPNRATHRLRWTARIWALVVVGIALLIVIGNLVSPNMSEADYAPIENLIPLTLFLSVLGLAVAWRWELAGGLINIGFFLGNLAVYWVINREFLEPFVIVLLSPLFIPGLLFLVCWWRSKDLRRDEI